MAALWGTVIIVLLLLPGVGFFIGFWSQERFARDVVKSSTLGEVALALFFALLVHWLLIWVVGPVFGFDVAFFLAPFADYTNTPPWLLQNQLMARAPYILFYLLGSTVIGTAGGFILGWATMLGPLRVLATHKWAFDLIKEKRKGVVSAYVMTKVIENNRILMYQGHLEEFFLDANGCLAYVVLRDCARYYMRMEGARPETRSRSSLFRLPDEEARRWEHLMITGDNIANILFDPLGDISTAKEDLEMLQDALQKTKLN